eukprot:FR742788.1.p1 GENE.FR742788.1~~FR742788.1.p1  ORF type:complete len:242 (+),score=35.36 FR742788.1:72-797(+)
MALYTLTYAADVETSHADTATSWDVWDSKGDPKTFPYKYSCEERVVIICGKAQLTPDDTAFEPFTVETGDAVVFHPGFACTWKVIKPMKKYFCFFDEDGNECAPPGSPKIACDAEGCGKECWDESYLTKGGLDICPKCFKKARGAEKKSYVGAEHQKEGEPFLEEEETKPLPKSKRAKTAKTTKKRRHSWDPEEPVHHTTRAEAHEKHLTISADDVNDDGKLTRSEAKAAKSNVYRRRLAS